MAAITEGFKRCSWGCKQHKRSRDRSTQLHTRRRRSLSPLCMFAVAVLYNDCLFISLCVCLECVRACSSVKRRVCVSPYVWVWVWHVYIACQLVARGSPLAGWLAWQKMTNQSSEKMRLSWHQSGTNLRINCSRVDKHTHTCTHTPRSTWNPTGLRVAGCSLFVCLFTDRLSYNVVLFIYLFFSVWEKHFFPHTDFIAFSSDLFQRLRMFATSQDWLYLCVFIQTDPGDPSAWV